MILLKHSAKQQLLTITIVQRILMTFDGIDLLLNALEGDTGHGMKKKVIAVKNIYN